VERPDYYGNPAGLTDDLSVVQAVYSAFSARDLDRALESFDPGCEVHLEGTGRAIGRTAPYVGHAGLRDYFADVDRVWDELELHAEDFRVVPGSVIVMGSVSGRRDGDGAEIRRAVVWTWRLRERRVVFLRVADLGELRT
jgi:ketosteroid isomerase-like protein